jgi:hypothetical protein
MQQLEDALNIGLCGHFLILLAILCMAAFSVVAVQYEKLCKMIQFITLKYNPSQCCDTVSVERVPIWCLHRQGKRLIDQLQGKLSKESHPKGGGGLPGCKPQQSKLKKKKLIL